MDNHTINILKKPIYPCLWFDGNAKEAADFYCSVFSNTSIVDENPMVVMVKVGGQEFMFLNGGPMYNFTPAISFYSGLQSEEEIELIWEKLIENGRALMPLDSYPWSEKYGWVQDKFGISWQLTSDVEAYSDHKFIPALLFTGTNFGKAEEAINFYSSVFGNSSTKMVSRYGLDDPNGQDGKINHAKFELNGQLFVVMDSAIVHNFNFSEAISIVVECTDQAQIDYFWEKLLLGGGQESQCGWLKDKFGVSWQIIPEILSELLADPDRSERVIKAFGKMKKLNIAELKEA